MKLRAENQVSAADWAWRRYLAGLGVAHKVAAEEEDLRNVDFEDLSQMLQPIVADAALEMARAGTVLATLMEAGKPAGHPDYEATGEEKVDCDAAAAVVAAQGVSRRAAVWLACWEE